jgi:hypothetical protein
MGQAKLLLLSGKTSVTPVDASPLPAGAFGRAVLVPPHLRAPSRAEERRIHSGA